LEGNPGKRPLNSGEPIPDAAPSAKSAPKFLSARAKAEWHRLYEPLRRIGVLTSIDLSAFAAYCAAYGLWEEATERLNKEPRVIKTPTDRKQPNPWIQIAKQHAELMKSYLTEFGMTAVSRSRLVGAGTPPPPNPEAEDDEELPPVDPAPAGEFAGLLGKANRRPN
jgi:P27 family predicted phage terminase small subunit